MIWIGWLLLMPFAGAWWLCYKIVDVGVKNGGPARFLGILVSILVGSGSILAGYFIGPIVGWFIMAVGALALVTGTWRSMVESKPTKSDMEREFLRGLMGKGQLGKSDQEKWDSMWISAKEEAKIMLQQDDIDIYGRVSSVRSTLASRADDSESLALYGELGQLQWKSTIKEAKRILEQDTINNYTKEERDRFNGICYELRFNQHRPEAKELWIRLQELKDSEVKNKKR